MSRSSRARSRPSSSKERGGRTTSASTTTNLEELEAHFERGDRDRALVARVDLARLLREGAAASRRARADAFRGGRDRRGEAMARTRRERADDRALLRSRAGEAVARAE